MGEQYSYCLIRVEPECVDRSRAGLDCRYSHPFPPIPDVGRALAVRADRAEQPAVGAEVQTADLPDEWGVGRSENESGEGVRRDQG